MCTMAPRMTMYLALLVLLALYGPGTVSGRLLCKDRHETCSPMAGDCCSGMACRQGVAGRWNCDDAGDGHLHDKRAGLCQRRGQMCIRGINNNCCPGLRCRPKPTRPNISECW